MLGKIITLTLRMTLILVAITCIGQIPYKGVSLERRYHEMVNSRDFQKAFWVVARPVTWTNEKVKALFEEREFVSYPKGAATEAIRGR